MAPYVASPMVLTFSRLLAALMVCTTETLPLVISPSPFRAASLLTAVPGLSSHVAPRPLMPQQQSHLLQPPLQQPARQRPKRQKRQWTAQGVVLLAVVSNVALSALKFVAGVASGSAALVADAGHFAGALVLRGA